MKRPTYEDNQTVPVGFPNTDNALYLAADTASREFTGAVIVNIKPESGDVWIAIGVAPTATAQTDGSSLYYYGIPEDIGIEKGQKIIATGPISVTPYK